MGNCCNEKASIGEAPKLTKASYPDAYFRPIGLCSPVKVNNDRRMFLSSQRQVAELGQLLSNTIYNMIDAVDQAERDARRSNEECMEHFLEDTRFAVDELQKEFSTKLNDGYEEAYAMLQSEVERRKAAEAKIAECCPQCAPPGDCQQEVCCQKEESIHNTYPGAKVEKISFGIPANEEAKRSQQHPEWTVPWMQHTITELREELKRTVAEFGAVKSELNALKEAAECCPSCGWLYSHRTKRKDASNVAVQKQA